MPHMADLPEGECITAGYGGNAAGLITFATDEHSGATFTLSHLVCVCVCLEERAWAGHR